MLRLLLVVDVFRATAHWIDVILVAIRRLISAAGMAVGTVVDRGIRVCLVASGLV